MNQHRNKQITDETYDESEMRTRQKQRNVNLEIPSVSNKTTEILERKRAQFLSFHWVAFKIGLTAYERLT